MKPISRDFPGFNVFLLSSFCVMAIGWDQFCHREFTTRRLRKRRNIKGLFLRYLNFVEGKRYVCFRVYFRIMLDSIKYWSIIRETNFMTINSASLLVGDISTFQFPREEKIEPNKMHHGFSPLYKNISKF